MVTNEDSENAGGFSERTSTVIQYVLIVMVIIASVLTQYVSPYFTITTVIILLVILVIFLIFKDRHATERYKAKLKQQEDMERQRQWNETTRELTTHSVGQGTIRNAKFAMCQAILSIFEESSRDTTLTDQQREFYREAIKRIRDVQQTVMQIW